MNTVVLAGNICNEFEPRFTPGGTMVADFTLAINDGKDKDGNPKSQFIRCRAWQKTAEILTQYCAKGDKITVQGRIKSDNYQKNGDQMYYTYVSVQDLSFGFKPKKGEQ